MIKIVNKLVMVVLLGASTTGVAFAREMKREVTFSEPVVVNGTLVKTGNYEAVFDDQTNELSIVKGRKVIARAPAQLEKREGRAHHSYVTRPEEGDPTATVLLSVGLKNDNQATIMNTGDSAQ